MRYSEKQAGFTLIELAIVLLIIGLLSSAILIGHSLIRAAQLRRIHSDFESYVAAANAFRVKYACLPGDCPNATDFFGALPIGSGIGQCPSLAAASPANPAVFKNDFPGIATCDGDSDGRLDANNTFYEMTTFWQQLAAAKLIPGSFTGGWPSAEGPAWVGGFNAPPVLSDASHWMALDGTHSILQTMLGIPATIVPATNLGTVLSPSAGSINPQVKTFTPTEAASYDAKYDDGEPVTGNILVAYGSKNCTNAPDEAHQSPVNATAHYLANDSLHKDEFNCALIFNSGF